MPATAFIPIVFIAFLVAFVLGWWRYRSFLWNLVDLIYYPLAAVGVVLFFISNDVQRKLLDVTQLAEKQSVALAELRAMKPDVKIMNVENLLTSNINHLALISRWVDICHAGPYSATPKCLAVKDLGPPVDLFLKVARGSFSSYEDRLLATCIAGDKLLEDIRASQAISTLVMDKFLAQYVKTASLNLSPLDFNAIVTAATQFRGQATSYAEQINRLAFKANDESARLLLDIHIAEIEYGEMLFLGLSQCMSAPRTELEKLKTWNSTASTQEQEVAQLEEQRRQLRQSATNHTTSLWLQLNLWPLVLLAALSLKFSKGAASYRKARRDAA